MFTIRFDAHPPAETHAEQELTLLSAAKRAELPLTHRCGGHARCGSCRVRVLSGGDQLSEMGTAERRVLEILKAAPDERLATDLTRARLALLAPVWPSAWGDPTDFADAVLGISGAEPNPLALEQFDRVDASC